MQEQGSTALTIAAFKARWPDAFKTKRRVADSEEETSNVPDMKVTNAERGQVDLLRQALAEEAEAKSKQAADRRSSNAKEAIREYIAHKHKK